ncbi:MAG: hypothetical protein ACLP5H_13490, partial [Desulfomonilaceae bacterium]
MQRGKTARRYAGRAGLVLSVPPITRGNGSGYSARHGQRIGVFTSSYCPELAPRICARASLQYTFKAEACQLLLCPGFPTDFTQTTFGAESLDLFLVDIQGSPN